MFRNEVLVMDAVVAITLMECSLNKSASFGNVNILHTSFPDNAEIEYMNQGEFSAAYYSSFFLTLNLFLS